MTYNHEITQLRLLTYHDLNKRKRVTRPKAFWHSYNSHTLTISHPSSDHIQIQSMVRT